MTYVIGPTCIGPTDLSCADTCPVAGTCGWPEHGDWVDIPPVRSRRATDPDAAPASAGTQVSQQ